jgi:hypothetical protein
MRSAEAVFEDLEVDRAQREKELSFVMRQMSTDEKSANRDAWKRLIVLLTYSHLEGFCKFSLSAYVGAINSFGLECHKAAPAIAAASLTNVFAALRDPQRKHPAFRRTSSDDTYLHLSAREQEFISSFQEVFASPVCIPEKIIETKQNIDGEVLQKLLFQVGLDFSLIEKHKATMSKLLGIRNAIAHGDRLKVPEDEDVSKYINAAYYVMKFLQIIVYDALRQEAYLKRQDEEGTNENAG